MKTKRYYYLNSDGKEVRHFAEEQATAPQGFVFSGMSELPVKGAAGYYTKGASGFKVIDGDELSKAEEAPAESPEEE